MAGMKRVVLHLHGETFARRYQIASHAITSAAAGDEVVVVLWFDALRRWVLGGFDEAEEGSAEGNGVSDEAVARCLGALGLPPPSEMLGEARALGAKIWACETAVRLAGLSPSQAKEKVDDLPGLQEILAAAKEAACVLYV